MRRHRDGCAEPRRTLTEAPGHEGPGRAGDSRGWGRPGAKAARGGGRGGARTSDPAPPLTRFSSSSAASGARAAAATTSHCLFCEPQARSPRLPSAPPGPPRHGRRGLPLAAAAATLQLLCRSRLSHWPSSALGFSARPHKTPSVPPQNPATPALPLRAANCCGWFPPLSFVRCHGDVSPPTARSRLPHWLKAPSLGSGYSGPSGKEAGSAGSRNRM